MDPQTRPSPGATPSLPRLPPRRHPLSFSLIASHPAPALFIPPLQIQRCVARAAAASALVSSDSSAAYGGGAVKDGRCHPAKCLPPPTGEASAEHREETAERRRRAHPSRRQRWRDVEAVDWSTGEELIIPPRDEK